METINEKMILNIIKKMPDDIINKIFKYIKSPFNIEIKNVLKKRTRILGDLDRGLIIGGFYGIRDGWRPMELPLAFIKGIGKENAIKGRTRKEIIQKLMKL